MTTVTYLQRTVALPQTLPQPMRDNHLERDQMDIGTTLMLSILFGSIGAGYFLYGKKQQQCVPLLTGIALCVYPYFLSNGYAIAVVGLILTAVPWFIRL